MKPSTEALSSGHADAAPDTPGLADIARLCGDQMPLPVVTGAPGADSNQLKANALREFAYRAPGTIARHFALTQALALEGKINLPVAVQPTVAQRAGATGDRPSDRLSGSDSRAGARLGRRCCAHAAWPAHRAGAAHNCHQFIATNHHLTLAEVTF